MINSVGTVNNVMVVNVYVLKFASENNKSTAFVR